MQKEQEFTEKDKMQKLVDAYGTPLFVIDHEALRKQCKKFSELMPRFSCHYAIKVNPVKEILMTMYQQGFGFDMASVGEFEMIQEVIKDLKEDLQKDFLRNKVIYANPVKSTRSLQDLNKYGLLTTYDNFEEINKIKNYAPNMRLILRISSLNPYTTNHLSKKFGCKVEDALPLIEAAIASGLQVEGISFHVGSQCTNPQAYVDAMRIAFKIFEIAETKGIKLKKLDIGGGFPLTYDQKEPYYLEDFAKAINLMADEAPKSIQFMAEPGRVMVGEACTVISQIIGKSERDGKQALYLDDGIYGSLMVNIIDYKRLPIPLWKEGEPKPTIIFGPTCDSCDTIGEELLPDMRIGDLVYFTCIGAYTIALATKFNALKQPGIVNINL